MRRPTSPLVLLVALALAVGAAACSDDGGGGDAGATSTTAAGPTTTVPNDPDLARLLLTADDLPEGFSPVPDVGTTVTGFCAGEDATAGLQASGRAVLGFNRTPVGASVIHLVFRFRSGDAATFVRQADEILSRCNEVPDAQGLAFTYEPLADEVAEVLEATDASTGRFGTNVGSASFTEQIAVFRQGDVGHLVAVLGVDLPRAELDALAGAAFGAAVVKETG